MIVLGAGMTGLAAGLASRSPVYEEAAAPGGVCTSYYMRPGSQQRLRSRPEDGEAYRFELGGGHWIFGGDAAILRFVGSLAPVECYARRSSVFFPDERLYVPYPLQNHLGSIKEETRIKALSEILASPRARPRTLEEWLRQSFGATLTEMFFGPFHEMYTAGLWKEIAPQDPYKSPVDLDRVIQGMFGGNSQVGYNVSFVYPTEGLNSLATRMAERCEVHYQKRAAAVDVRRREVEFADGSTVHYELLVSTLPLSKMVEMTRLELDEEPGPYTSVLVLNIGAKRGAACPGDHWVYVSRSKAGFHRVGFYSNVDVSFLPQSSRALSDRVSIYAERAFAHGSVPAEQDIQEYVEAATQELRDWGYIGDAEVADATWIDVAYTWSWPGSKWRSRALEKLEENDILMVGRYARWNFQGIADSIRDGLYVGATACLAASACGASGVDV